MFIWLSSKYIWPKHVHYDFFLYYTGIEDKLVATDGYGIVIMDEASSFFQEIKGQDVTHESNIVSQYVRQSQSSRVSLSFHSGTGRLSVSMLGGHSHPG